MRIYNVYEGPCKKCGMSTIYLVAGVEATGYCPVHGIVTCSKGSDWVLHCKDRFVTIQCPYCERTYLGTFDGNTPTGDCVHCRKPLKPGIDGHCIVGVPEQ